MNLVIKLWPFSLSHIEQINCRKQLKKFSKEFSNFQITSLLVICHLVQISNKLRHILLCNLQVCGRWNKEHPRTSMACCAWRLGLRWLASFIFHRGFGDLTRYLLFWRHGCRLFCSCAYHVRSPNSHVGPTYEIRATFPWTWCLCCIILEDAGRHISHFLCDCHCISTVCILLLDHVRWVQSKTCERLWINVCYLIPGGLLVFNAKELCI